MHPQYREQDIPVITVPPDWDDPPILSLEHKTLVFEALDLSEERLAMYAWPLFGLRYQTTTLSARESGYLRKLFELAQGLPVGCPLWSDPVRLTAPADTGATVIAVSSTVDTLFEVLDTHALLWTDFARWEVVELTAVAEAELTLRFPTTAAFPAGALVLPLAFGHVRRPQATHLSTEHASVLIEFQETFSVVTPSAPPLEPLVIATESLPGAQVGVPYAESLTATGGLPPYSWVIASGALPDGLNLQAATGIISGTPTTPQTGTFEVQVTDSAP